MPKTDYRAGSYPNAVSSSDFDGDGDIDMAVTNINSDKVSILVNRNREVDILLSKDFLEYGPVTIDSTESLEFMIHNYGIDSVLHITDITSSNTVFQPEFTTAIILPNDSLSIPVNFTPTDLINYFDSLSIVSNDPYKSKLKVYITGFGFPIISHTPTQNALNINKSTDISVIFNEDMNPSTINANTFIVQASQTGKHAGIFIYDNGTNTALFNPEDDFMVGEVITVILTTGIETLAGDTLPCPYEWSFTIETDGGGGLFMPKTDYPSANSPQSVFSADLDNNGTMDLVTANVNSDNVSVLKNNGDGTFQSKVDYGTAADPRAVYSADLDADGDMDLAVATNYNYYSYNASYISILLNNGNGTFQTKTDYMAGKYPESIYGSDLDADGDMDLITANSSSNSVSVYLNNGNATFQPKIDFTTGDLPYSAFSADLDDDGDMDLITANLYSNNVSVLLNQGDGTFSPKTDYNAGSNPYAVFSSDLDADGDMDLAVANESSNSVSILLNKGDGTFPVKTDFVAGNRPYSLFSSDLDKDGDMDLAVANYNSDNVSVLLNNGNGTFMPKTDYPAGNGPQFLVASDLDADGDMDLAVTNSISNNISILLNRNRYADISLSSDSLNFELGALNQTETLQFTVTNYGVDSILHISGIISSNPVFVPNISSASVLPGQSISVNVDFIPTEMINYADSLIIVSSDPDAARMKVFLFGTGFIIVGHTPQQNESDISENTNISVRFSMEMNAATMNANSFIIQGSQTGLHTGTYNYDNGTKSMVFDPYIPFAIGEMVTVVLNTAIENATGDTLPRPYQWSFNIQSIAGSGEFLAKNDFTAGNYPHGLYAADLDADGSMDLAVANYSSDNVSVLLNKGDGTYLSKTDYNAGDGPYAVYSSDLDRDGDLDLVTANYNADNISVLYNNGNGAFQARTDLAVGDGPRFVSVADLDGDGDRDLAVANSGSDNISVLLNQGNGTFQPQTNYAIGDSPESAFPADLDGDGDMDLVAANSSSGYVSILMNNSDGTFQPKTDYYVALGANAIFAADFDGDGDLDLAVTVSYTYNLLYVLLNDGDGIFPSRASYTVGSAPESVFASDLDSDGDPDLTVANRNSSTISVLRNNGNGTFSPKVDYATGQYPQSVFSSDLDIDGDMDLVVANYNSGNVSVLYNSQREPDIWLSSRALNFEQVPLDSTKNMEFLIYNFGTENTLNISSIVSSNPVFVPAITSVSVLPRENTTLSVSFTPKALITYTDSLTITCNDPHKPQVKVYLRGEGKDTVPPVIPFITITSPNGGENWQTGSIRDIIWTSAATSGTVRIEYSANNGNTWTDVVASTVDDGLYTLDNPGGDFCKLPGQDQRCRRNSG